MKKRCLFTMVIGAIAFCMLAACGGPVESNKEETIANTEGTAAASDEVSREETLVWTVPVLPPGLDVYYYSTLQAMEVIRNVYDSAIAFPPIKDESGFLILNIPIQAWQKATNCRKTARP